MQKIFLALAASLALAVSSFAQDAAAAAKSNRTIGEVTAIDGKSITIKPDAAGGTVTVALDPVTKYLKVPAKEPDMKKAAKINASEIGVGDRVLAVVRPAEGQKPAFASTVVVMTKEDLAQKRAADQAEWQRRGVGGTVTAVDSSKNEISIETRTREGKKSVVVDAAKATFRRYAPDSVRFSEAKASSIAEVKVGDQLRVLGDKNADETRVTAQEIVGGTFRNIAATVKTVDPANGEIEITNLETKKPMVVKVNPDSTLRRLPQQLAMMLAMRLNGANGGQTGMGAGGAGFGAPGGGQGARMQRPAGDAAQGAGAAGGPGGQQWRRGPDAAGGTGAGGPGAGAAGGPGGWAGGQGGGFGRGAASGDLSQMIERMPPVQLSELKPGDAIIVASTAGADPSRATAITVLAGVEPLLTAPRQQEGRGLGQWNFDINIVPQ